MIKTFDDFVNEGSHDEFSNLVANGGPYLVMVTAIKNNVGQWSTQTLDDAELSIKLYLKTNKLTRVEAKIYKILSTTFKKSGLNKQAVINKELVKTVEINK